MRLCDFGRVLPVRLSHVCPRKCSRSRQLRGVASHGLRQCKAQANFYEVLGVDKGASVKEIRAAFKKQALKLHPDVNKAPDAADQFKRARHAYQVLSDDTSRAEHDRKLKRGSAKDWDPPFFTSRPTSRRGKYTPEPSYGLDDVFRDLGKAFSEFEEDLQKKDDDSIGSLWDELGNLGQEFVEFLEQEAGIDPDQPYPKDTIYDERRDVRQPREEQKQERGRSIEEDVEQALQELKKQMGL